MQPNEPIVPNSNTDGAETPDPMAEPQSAETLIRPEVASAVPFDSTNASAQLADTPPTNIAQVEGLTPGSVLNGSAEAPEIQTAAEQPVDTTEPPMQSFETPVEPASVPFVAADRPVVGDIPSAQQPINGNYAAPEASTLMPSSKNGGGKKKKLLFASAGVALLLLLSGGYAWAFYIPSMPGNVYKSGLSRTSQAYDKLVNYTSTVQAQKYSGLKTEGSFKYTSADGSGDGDFSFQAGAKNTTGEVNIDFAGEKIKVNTRSITADRQTVPDWYFQVSGVKTLVKSIGLDSLSNLDGQWISVDHTLLETVAANAAKDTQKSTATLPSDAQIQDGLKSFGEVNNQYLFKPDAAHAVIKNKKFLGKSSQDGRQVYGYEVGYDKSNLKAYLKALQSGLNETSLNDWSQKATGKSISKYDIKSLLSSIDKADGNYTFTMYINAKTKLVDTLHFKDTKSNDYFEISQQYDGGDVYPFSFKLVSTSDPDSAGTATLQMKLDSKTNKVTIDAKADIKEGGSPITLTFNAAMQGSNDEVKTTAPANAKSVLDVINSLGLGGLLGT